MKKYFFLLLLVPFFFVGCGGAPRGMPKVYPCSITVKNDGVPMPNANVVFIPEGQLQNAQISGKANDEGVAEIKTIFGSYIKKGAPEGKFKITITESQDVIHTATEEERAKMSPAEGMAYEAKIIAEMRKRPKIVPAILSQPIKTPLSIEVNSSGDNTAEFDIADHK